MTENLYCHKTGDQWDEVIMPDEFGMMNEPAPNSKGWYAVQWPVNPHFTGAWAILDILNNHMKAVQGPVLPEVK